MPAVIGNHALAQQPDVSTSSIEHGQEAAVDQPDVRGGEVGDAGLGGLRDLGEERGAAEVAVQVLEQEPRGADERDGELQVMNAAILQIHRDLEEAASVSGGTTSSVSIRRAPITLRSSGA